MSWLAAGILCCAAAVAAGAFGAHGLAARYLMYGGLALAILGLAAQVTGRNLAGAGWCLLAGSLIFSSTVAGLALGAPRWLGAVTPIGGLLMIVGLILFALGAARG